MFSPDALAKWNIGFFGMYSLQFLLVPSTLIDMNFVCAQKGAFVDFCCRFVGIWGVGYCIATYCVKNKEQLMPANMFVNVMCLMCGPALAEFSPSTVGITGVTAMHHVGLVGCAGSVLAHGLAMTMPVKAKKSKK